MHKAKVLDDIFFASVFTGQTGTQQSQVPETNEKVPWAGLPSVVWDYVRERLYKQDKHRSMGTDKIHQLLLSKLSHTIVMPL